MRPPLIQNGQIQICLNDSNSRAAAWLSTKQHLGLPRQAQDRRESNGWLLWVGVCDRRVIASIGCCVLYTIGLLIRYVVFRNHAAANRTRAEDGADTCKTITSFPFRSSGRFQICQDTLRPVLWRYYIIGNDTCSNSAVSSACMGRAGCCLASDAALASVASVRMAPQGKRRSEMRLAGRPGHGVHSRIGHTYTRRSMWSQLQLVDECVYRTHLNVLAQYASESFHHHSYRVLLLLVWLE